ncbi:NADPH:quinone reductase [Paracraurococcus ruber]|uniref:NADPH:quinone oxidoreductase n=1 Tax=Paracraurococcus ruber TaxID=77675 RepID=A0ABS1CWH8_9PROT|nr:NADPH:quinone reductase [Paracraurococcus ruber]MBK1658868.1 NADPH:quinone oxidoreductase [Paracraurococcus ruber]TDG30197.1 NADPH:quinone reductase [Paracraurococcus ruber]
MKAVWYDRNGDSSVLTYGDLPTPAPGPGEVLVRLAASGVNPSDWKTRRGSRPMAFPRVIPHSDGAGTVEAVGEGVDRGRIGQRVWIWNGQWKRAFGTAAECIALPAAQAVPLPDNTAFEAGACLGIPALTALHGVLTDGGVTGQTVLVTGGAGSVGHYAIQFARLLGAARVLATVSSEEKAAHAMAAGADATVNYRSEDVAARIADLTGGAGVQRVVDVDLSTTAGLLPAVLAPGGICAAYGSNGPAATMQFGPAIMKGIAVRWFIVYELSAAQRAVAVDTLQAWLRAGLVTHAVAARVPLADCAAAHDAVEGGRFIGNLVLDC